MAEFKSKHGIVSRSQAEMYMSFTDMRNFLNYLPEDKKQGITADYDSIKASVQGFNIGVTVTGRTPYSRIAFSDDGASPFRFGATMFFDDAGDPGKTDFHIEVSAELNFMMQMMLGSKLKDALNKIVDGLVDASEGRMPEGFDPSMFKGNA